MKNIPKKIEALLFQPMLINEMFGFSAWMNHVADLLTFQSNNSLALEVYKQKRVDEETQMFLAEDGLTQIQANENGGFDFDGEQAIAKVHLKGTMLAEGGLCSRGIDYTCSQLNALAANPNVIGAVLNTHSGGGQVVAAQRLTNSIREFRKVKPIVQFVDGMSASGAVMAGVNCNKIIMGGSTTETGSIGVVIQMDRQIIEELKANLKSIYADGSEDKHDIFKAILDGNDAYVKKHGLNPVKAEFHKLVKTERNLNLEVENVLTGKMYTARSALKFGLADQIGVMADAMKRVSILAKKNNRIKSSKKVLANVY